MQVSKTLTALLSLSIFLVVVNGVQAVNLKNEESACLSQTRCDQTNPNACSEDDTNPLIRVHRVLLEINASLSSSEVFIHECILIQGAQICLPLPIERTIPSDPTSPWKIKNYKANGNTSVVWAGNTQHQQFFKDALEQKCVARYMDPAQGATMCHEFYYGNGSDIVGYFNEANGDWYNVNRLLTNSNYQFHGLYQGVTNVQDHLTPLTNYPVTGNQNTRFEWGSSTSLSLTRSFRVTAFSNPITGTTGGAPSDKVGKLGFLSNATVCENAPNYDPFGQVFDTESLQPIEDTKVSLYKLNPSPPPGTIEDQYILVTRINTPTILDETFTNPQLSGPLGEFNFLVPSGKYKLLVARESFVPPNPLAELPISTSVMNSNAAQLGNTIAVTVDNASKTLYPQVYQVSAMGANINVPVIIEGNSAERRDIAVVTLTPAPARPLTYFRTVNASGDNVISGQINKPFGLVTAKKLDGTVLLDTRASVDGKFTLVINSNILPVNEAYEIEASPRQLTRITPTPTIASGISVWVNSLLDHLFPQVHAQSVGSSVVIKPRLNFIEGYAYDSVGGKLKNAEVIIFDMVSGTPSYSTMTDQEGFYRVMSENLPLNDYSIYYVPEGSSKMIKTDAEKFISQNEQYIEEKDINYAKPQFDKSVQVYLTQHPEPSVSTTQGTGMGPKQGTPGQTNQGVAPTRAVEQNSPVNQLSPALLMYVAILLLLIVGAGLLIVYYMKRRQEPHLYE